MAPNQNCNCLAISGFCFGGWIGGLAVAAIGAGVVMGRISEMVVKFQDHIDEANAGTCDMSTTMIDETWCVRVEANAPRVENDDIRGQGYYCEHVGDTTFGQREYECPCDVTRRGTSGNGIRMNFSPDPAMPAITNYDNVWVRDISWTEADETVDYGSSYQCFYTFKTADFEHMFWLGYDKTEVVDEIKSWVEGIDSIASACLAGGIVCLLASIAFCLCGCCVCCKTPPGGQPVQTGAQPAIVGQPYGQQPAYAQQQPVYMQQQQPPAYAQPMPGSPGYAQPMPGYAQPMQPMQPVQGTVVQPVGQMAT